MKIKSVDVFIQSATVPKVENVDGWSCTDVFNRGTRVEAKISCHMTDVYQCRFSLGNSAEANQDQVLKLLAGLNEKKIIWSNVHLIF